MPSSSLDIVIQLGFGEGPMHLAAVRQELTAGAAASAIHQLERRVAALELLETQRQFREDCARSRRQFRDCMLILWVSLVVADALIIGAVVAAWR